MNRNYRVLARLGEGGMAIVHLAVIGGSEGFRKLVALKVLREQEGIDVDELRQMFAHEARVSARCHHRNVVQFLDACQHDGKPALCMEYLDGQTYRRLKAKAEKTGKLPLFEQLRILAEAAHGLHHVHTLRDYAGQPLGLVHCDVSPENIFVTYDGQVKLLDFGIAQAHSDIPRAPGFRGKVGYLAPELITGGPIDARTDVFALGAMLWEAVSVAPFSGGPSVDHATKLRTRIAGNEGNIRAVQPDVPEALARIIDRAIALHPQQRFADAEAFAFALEDYLRMAGAQPSAQSLSAFVMPLFEREAARLRAVVDPQLQYLDQLEAESQHLASAPPAPYAFRGASDTVDPGSQPPPSNKRVASLVLVAVLCIANGALLGFLFATRRTPAPVAQPASVTPSATGSAPAVAATPTPPHDGASPRVGTQAPPSSADSPVQVADNVQTPMSLTSAPCITTAQTLGEEMRRLAVGIVQAEDRRSRHHERRLRRRAAQCAAGRLEKCDPIPDPT